MPTPSKGYYTKSGIRVPGTTTVIGRFKESGALMHWAYEQGKLGLDYRDTSKAAADAGTCAHDMIECWKKKTNFDSTKYPGDIISVATGAYNAFLEWAEQTKLEIIETEIGLVSEKYQYGGTLDAMLVKGKLSLGDWKTSSGCYPDYVLQLAAYGQLWEENNPHRNITGGYHLMRFNKQHQVDDPVSFTHHYWSDLSVALKMFLLLREAYELDRRVKKMV